MGAATPGTVKRLLFISTSSRREYTENNFFSASRPCLSRSARFQVASLIGRMIAA